MLSFWKIREIDKSLKKRDNDHTRSHHPGVNISFPFFPPKAYFGERWYNLDGIVQIILGLPFSPNRR